MCVCVFVCLCVWYWDLWAGESNRQTTLPGLGKNTCSMSEDKRTIPTFPVGCYKHKTTSPKDSVADG